MKHIIYTLLALTLLSCSQREVNSSDISIRDGLFYVQGDEKPFSGKIIVERHNKSIDKEYVVKNGKYHGIQKRYNRDGLLVEEYGMKEGVPHGPNRMFSSTNGALMYEAIYQQGAINGVQKRYYETGALQDEVTFRFGKKHGFVRFYNKEGNVAFEKIYKDDEIAEVTVMSEI